MKWTTEMLDQLIYMKKMGVPLNEIAKEFGCDYKSVQNQSARLIKKGIVPRYKKGTTKGSKIMENDIKAENEMAVVEQVEDTAPVDGTPRTSSPTESVGETTVSVGETSDSVGGFIDDVKPGSGTHWTTYPTDDGASDAAQNPEDDLIWYGKNSAPGSVGENRKKLVEMIEKGLGAADSAGINVVSFKVFIHQRDESNESFLSFEKHLMIAGLDKDGYAVDIEIKK